VWDPVAHVLGQLCHTLVLTGVPRRIVMGGGVMVGNDHLFPRVRAAMVRSLAGYVALPEIAEPGFVVPPALGGNAGPLGAILLGAQALDDQQTSFTAF
jgi:fructokinase